MPELDEPTSGTTEPIKPDDAATGAEASDAAADRSASEDPSVEDRIAALERKNEQLLSEKTGWQRQIDDLKRDKASPHPPATGDGSSDQYREDLRLRAEVRGGMQPTIAHMQAIARLSEHAEFLAEKARQKLEKSVAVVRLPDDVRDEAE